MIYIALMALVCLVVAAFAVQNATVVTVSFLIWEFPASLAVVIIGSLVAGLFIAFCWGLKLKAQHYIEERKIKENISYLENENAKLQEKMKMLMHAQQQRTAAEQRITTDA